MSDFDANFQREIGNIKDKFNELEEDINYKYRQLRRDYNEHTDDFEDLQRLYEDYEDECVYNHQQLYRDLLLSTNEPSGSAYAEGETNGQEDIGGDESAYQQDRFDHRSSYNKMNVKCK